MNQLFPKNQHVSHQLCLKVKSIRGLTIERDPIPDASSVCKGKNSTNTLIKIHWFKINQAPACIAPAQLLVILLGVNVNVLM